MIKHFFYFFKLDIIFNATFNAAKILFLMNLVFVQNIQSADRKFSQTIRFESDYQCKNISKKCVASGERDIDGIKVYRDCWQWEYNKQCEYPSKHNCDNYKHCYFVAKLNCLVHDSQGDCVNRQYEFSCPKEESFEEMRKKVRTKIEDSETESTHVCVGTPCMDGDCFDHSYDTNGAMMSSLSMLHAAKEMKPDSASNFNLFKGQAMHCSRKPTGYTNCCRRNIGGWGKQLGAGCNANDRALNNKRYKKHCHYIGKQVIKKLKVVTAIKEKFCCFNSVLDRLIQEQGRAQIGKGWGSAKHPNCRGFTKDEIQRIDFTKIDFSEFIEELKANTLTPGNNKMPNVDQIKNRMQQMKKDDFGVRKYDPHNGNKENNRSGFNDKANKKGE